MQRLRLLVALVVIGAALAGCTTRAPMPSPAINVKDRAVRTLRSLHDKIVYVVREDVAGTDRYIYHLFWIDPDEKKPHEMLSTEATATEGLTTVYTPGRDRMVVHMAVSGNTRTGNDYTADIDGTNPRLLVRGHVSDFFSDGRLLVRSDVSEGSLTYFLYEADPTGEIVRRITRRPPGVKRKIGREYMYAGDWDGVVSPDGRTIVYASSWHEQREMRDDLFRISSDGTRWKRLTRGAKTLSDFCPEGFSHDGSAIAVTETRAETDLFRIMDPAGRFTSALDFGDRTGIEFGGWSPDDTRVALVIDGYQIQINDAGTDRLTTIVEMEDESKSILSAAWLE